MPRPLVPLFVLATLAFPLGCRANPSTQPAQPATQPAWTGDYHLHLCGISGYRYIDRQLVLGLADGGLHARIDHYDWTTADPGLGSLLAEKRNHQEAAKVARLLLKHYRAHPAARITVSAHSGGCAIIAWALEKLPPDVQIDSVVMLAPALSPGYDLSAMLRHIRGHVYVFYSQYDGIVLGVGTSLFGTMDGVKTDAAGKVGFKAPADADQAQYKKLVQFPYERDWLKLGDLGDHVGPMTEAFGDQIIAPLLLTGHLPTIGDDSTASRSTDRATASTDSPAANTR
jgi:hypothetical protein